MFVLKIRFPTLLAVASAQALRTFRFTPETTVAEVVAKVRCAQFKSSRFFLLFFVRQKHVLFFGAFLLPALNRAVATGERAQRGGGRIGRQLQPLYPSVCCELEQGRGLAASDLHAAGAGPAVRGEQEL